MQTNTENQKPAPLAPQDYQRLVFALLKTFAHSRPGIDPRNYGDWKSYRSESRSITQDLHRFRELYRAAHWRTFTPEQIRDGFRAYSGRLDLIEDEHGRPVRLEYCTGQYYPTEFRKAAAAVIASMLWDQRREDCPKDEQRKGDWIRASFRREFGRGIASRYFD
jgi:hypothetical protein